MYLWGLDRKIILAIFLWYTAVYCIVFNSLTQICVKYSSLCPQLYVYSLASLLPKGGSQLGWPVLSVHSSQCPKGARNAELNYSVLLKAPPSAHTGWECLMAVCVCGQPCAGVEKRTCLRSLTSSRAIPLQLLGGQWAVTCLLFLIRDGHFRSFYQHFSPWASQGPSVLFHSVPFRLDVLKIKNVS